MRKIEIENREKELTGGKEPFVMVDLIIDGETINTGNEPISSYSFWEDIEKETQRALFRIKTKNPRLNFNFNFQTLGMSKEERNDRFVNHLKNKYTTVDVDKVLGLLADAVSQIKPTGPDDNHPNPEIKFPIDSDLFKDVLISVINKLETNKNQKS